MITILQNIIVSYKKQILDIEKRIEEINKMIIKLQKDQ